MSMNKFARMIDEEFEAVRGTVIASYSDLIRVQHGDSEPVGFKVGAYLKELPVGTLVTVIALRGSDKAFYVINHDTDTVRKIDLWSGNVSMGFQRFQSGMRFLAFPFLLIPIVGQLTAAFGGVAAIVTAVASSGVRGMPPISVSRIAASLSVYFVGSLWYFFGRLSGDLQDRNLGFVILAIGAGLYCFYASRPSYQYLNAINDLVGRCRKETALQSA